MPATAGTTIPEAEFPRFAGRRLDCDQAASMINVFAQEATEHLDYSVDLTTILNSGETITAAWADTSVPGELIVSSVRYAAKGVVAWIYGGLDGVIYDLVITVRTESARVLSFKAEVTIWGNYANNLAKFTLPTLGDPVNDPAQNYLVDVLGAYVGPTWVDDNGVLLVPDFGSDP